MSNARRFRRPRRRLSPVQTEVARVLGPLDGAQVPGGCECCDAYQTVHPQAHGVWVVAVHHDTWCPLHGRPPASPAG
jgi:hypothetical protein